MELARETIDVGQQVLANNYFSAAPVPYHRFIYSSVSTQVLIFCATKKWAKTCAKKIAAYYGKRARTGRAPAGVTRIGNKEQTRLAAGRARLVKQLKGCWGSLSGLQRCVAFVARASLKVRAHPSE